MVYLDVDDPSKGDAATVQDIRIGGQGCSISQSSASMMSAAVKGRSIGEIKDFVLTTGAQGTRAVVGLGKDAGAAEDRLVAVPFDALHIELSGEEARAVPQQARVRVELRGKPLDTLPAYEYPLREAI